MNVVVEQVGRQALPSVENTGHPLEADVSRFVTPFARGRSTTDDTGGLGLAIVRAVVVAHGGTLGLSPRHGGGLSVEVRIAAWPS